MKTLELQLQLSPKKKRDVELARLRATGKHKLADAAERLWSALGKGKRS